MVQRTLRPIFWLVLSTMLFGVLPPATAPAVLAAPAYDRQDRTGQVAAPALAVQPQPLTPIASVSVPHPEPPPPSVPANAIGDLAPDLSQLPLTFVANEGQTDPVVRFYARGLGGALFFAQRELVMSLPAVPSRRANGRIERSTDSQRRPALAVRLKFDGDNPKAVLKGVDQLSGATNILIGNDPAKWRSNLATYTSLIYQGLYPGIDLRYSGRGAQIKSTYLIAPGADPSAIRWSYTGALKPQLDADGNLILALPAPGAPINASTPVSGTLIEERPQAWQEIGDRRILVDVHYSLGVNDRLSFVLGTYDRTRPLIIDPAFNYGTYLGGSDEEAAYGVATDQNGNIYVTGKTSSADFPTLNSNQNYAGDDAFVTKLTPQRQLVYSTYIGGNGGDIAWAIAVDSNKNAYVTGDTLSDNFPTPNGKQTSRTWIGRDAFLMKLDPSGQRLYGTYLGGDNDEYGYGLAADNTGNAYIVGIAVSPGSTVLPTPAGFFPITTNAYQPNHSPGAYGDAFFAKINTSASGDASLIYSTFLGGTGGDGGKAIAIDGAGNAYITGYTYSVDFPILNAYQGQINGDGNPRNSGCGQLDCGTSDAFITKINPNTSGAASLIYSTYLGGTEHDNDRESEPIFLDPALKSGGIVVDGTGNAYVTGWTRSNNFPTKNSARVYGGGTCTIGGSTYPCLDVFVTKLKAAGNDITFSTYLGGNNSEAGSGLILDSFGRAIVTGWTYSSNFPRTAGSPSLQGTVDGFVTTVSASGSTIVSSALLGGSTNDYAYGIARSNAGQVYLVGQTDSNDFLPGSPIQSGKRGFTDAFVVRAKYKLPPDQNRNPEKCPCGSAQPMEGRPINTRTGNLWTSTNDLTVESPGPTLEWTRIYNSQALTDTDMLLGYGWQHPYAARIITPTAEANVVTILSPRGNRLRFDQREDGTYGAWPGVYDTLVRVGTVFTQTLQNQQKYAFDAVSGKLLRMRDPLGRLITLTYAGTPQRLTRIADATQLSRGLTITYTADLAHIDRVGDGTREVRYQYTNDDLRFVLDVRNQTTEYQYSSHRLTKILDPLGQAVETTTYESFLDANNQTQWRAKTQLLQDSQQLTFDYQADRTVVTAVGSDGRQQTRTYTFASDETVTDQTISNQSVSSSTFDAVFGPAIVVDGNGYTTATTYAESGLPLQQTNALAQTTRLQYDTNRPTLITDTLGLTTRYDYDKLGNLLKITAGITTTSSIRAITSYTYHYLNASNSWVPLSQPLSTPFPKDSRLFEQTSSDGVVTRYEYTGTNPHQVTKTIVAADTALNQATTYGYDSLGRVTSTTTAFGTALARTDTTSYNADNTIAQTIQNYKNGVYDVHFPDEDIITQYGYDAIGRQIWVKDALGHYDVTHYNAKGQVDWTARNMSGYSGGALPATPPAYGLATTDANIATFYGYDGLGRTVLVTETGILTGTINTTTLQFSATISRTTRTEYDTLSRPMTVTLNYRPGMPQTADMNVPLYTRYDGAGNVITQTDTLGRWTVTRYDALNRPVMVITNYQDGVVSANEPTDQDSITGTEYDVGGRVARTIENWVNPPLVPQFDPNKPDINRVTVYAYDTLGRVTSTTQNYAPGSTGTALNRVSLTEFHPTTGRVTGQRDALGRWVNQQYDLLGRTITTIQNCTNSGGTPVNPAQAACAAFNNSFPDRNVPTQTAYDALNRVTDGTNTVNATTTVINHTVYDGLGRTLKQIQNYKSGTNGGSYSASTPDTNVTTSSLYDALGRTLAMTDTLGVATRTTVNALGQAITTTDPVGRVTQQGYDGSGMLRWSKRPDGQLTVFFIDGLGRVVTTIVNYKDGVAGANEPADTDLISRTIYDKAGRRIETVDANTRRTVFAYDNQDRLIGVTENAVSGTCALAPCTVVTAYGYDRAGNRTTITNALGVIRTFTYDAANQQTQATEPITAGTNRVTQWQYDAAGRMTKRIDPRGPNFDVSFGYDGMDRPTTTSASGMTTITNSYDGLGRRTQLVDGNTTTFTPDALGRITQINAPNTGVVGYTYDGLGRRTKLVYPTTGTTLNYSYLADGRLNTVTQGTSSPPTIARYSYDSVGRLVQSVTNASASITSQLVTNYGYDGTDRLTRQRTSEAGTTISGFDYQLNRNGLRTVITETLPLSPTISTTRIKTMTFEGASLTDATTGADSLSPAVAPTVTLETAAPIKGAYAATIANLGATSLREDFTAATDAYVTVYVRLNALPSSNTRIMQISNSGTTAGELLVLTNGKLRLRNNGTTIGLDSSALTVGAVYRVGVHQKSGSGTGVLEAFLAAGDAQFTSAFAASSTLTIAGAANRVNIGPTSSTNPMNLTLDEIAVDTAGLAGPVASSARRADGAAAPTGTIDPFAAQPSAEGSPARALAGRLPIAFIPNAGQQDAGVRFQARGMGGNLFAGANELTLALRTPTRDLRGPNPGKGDPRRPPQRNVPPTVVQQRWIGARPTAAMTGTLDLPGKANLYPDNNPAHWRTNLPMYAGTVTSQLYDGIDLHTTGVDGQLKTTYVVAPGTDPSRIRWRYQGHTSVALDAQGNLVVSLPAPANTLTDTEVLSSTLTELAPTASQTINEREVAVPVRFSIGPDGSVSFALGAYDPTQPLIIDPTLVYSTYLGGAGSDQGNGIAIDASGNLYITGSTASSNFPPANPNQGSLAGASDAFITKLNPTGSAYLYSTYLGGSLPTVGGGNESGVRIVVDSANNAYVTGYTSSSNFPATANARQSTLGGADDAFVAKLGPTGALLYASYVGGSGDEFGQGIAINSTGKVVLAGQTYSSNFPTTSPKQATYGGSADAFLALFDMTLSGANSLIFSTYLGGSAMDDGLDVAVDSGDAMYVGGTTASTNFPVTPGVYRTTCNGTPCQDAFVTKFTWNGTTLAHSYSTYLGGSGDEQQTGAIVVDSQNQAVRVGSTTSTDLPTLNPVQASNGGGIDTFVTTLNSAGSALVYSTYLGGSGEETPYDAAIDSQGVIALVGRTNSTNFPTSDPIQATNGDGGTLQDAYITQINPAVAGAAGLQMSTYFGGSDIDYGFGIVVESSFGLAVTGGTNSTNLPIKDPKQPSNGGGYDAFVIKLAIGGRRISHTYDGLQRLIGTVEAPGNSFAYTYDLAGNRTAVQVNGAAPAITTYNLANQITNAGYSYDLAGNLTNDGTATYTYDALNRTTARGTTTYAYNGDGTLVSHATGGVTTRYTQDLAAPLTQVLQTFTGTPRTDYLYGLSRLATQTSGVRTWYVSDALGSVRRTVSDAGVPLGIVSYDPWGTVESGTVPVFGFTGELQQGGDVYLRARWYTSAQGRFGSVDPFAGAAETPYSLHPYQYAYADPVRLRDASGWRPAYDGGGDPPVSCEDFQAAPGQSPPQCMTPTTSPTEAPKPAPTGTPSATPTRPPATTPTGVSTPVPTNTPKPTPDTPKPTPAHTPSVPCAPSSTPQFDDIGYIEGISGYIGAVGIGVGGIEHVFDLYDFEYGLFGFLGGGAYTNAGVGVTTYIGGVTGWSGRSVSRVENYSGPFVSVAVTVQLPFIVGVGLQGFAGQGMLGVAGSASIGLDELPLLGSLFGGVAGYKLLQKREFHTLGPGKQTATDAIAFMAFILSQPGGSTAGRAAAVGLLVKKAVELESLTP